jgi:hypothetical protein
MSGIDSKDKKLDELLEIVRKSPVLNGGFTRLSDSVDEIKESNLKVLLELQMVKENQDSYSEKLEKIHDALYDPDHGLYKRVAETTSLGVSQAKDIVEIKSDQKSMSNEQENLSQKLLKIEATENSLKTIAGNNLENLHSTISTRTTFVRGLWIIIGAALVGFAKIVWDVIIAFS